MPKFLQNYKNQLIIFKFMKNTTFNSILLGTLAASIALSGCSLKKMKKKEATLKYETTPEVLELKGDSVAFSVKGIIPKKYFSKRVVAELKPVLVYGNGGQLELTTKTVRGEKIAGQDEKITKKTGGDFTYRNQFAYNPDMATSTLYMDLTAKKKKKKVDFTRVKLAEGIIITPLLLKPTEEVMYGKDSYIKVVPTEKKGTIFFDIDKSVVKKEEADGASMTAFKQFIADGNQLTGVAISSYASPDGELTRNDKLSFARTEATYSALRTFLKAQGVAQVNDSSFYKTSATAEDWDGLKNLASNSTAADRDQIVKIVTTISNIEERETALKALPSYKNAIAKDLLPKLRRSEVTIFATEARKSDENILAMSQTEDAKMLTVEELNYATTLTTDNSKKVAIYNNLIKFYPNDWRGYNNLAATKLTEGGKEDEALTLLEKAASAKKDNAAVYNNTGVAYRNKKQWKKAEENYLLAKSYGANESINLGNLKVRTGDYNSALAYYGTANGCTFNSALAKTLNKNYDEALKAIDCIKTPDAATFYLKAIVGARQGNQDLMSTNITRAITADASFREKAKADKEFAKYFETDAFKAAVR